MPREDPIRDRLYQVLTPHSYDVEGAVEAILAAFPDHRAQRGVGALGKDGRFVVADATNPGGPHRRVVLASAWEPTADDGADVEVHVHEVTMGEAEEGIASVRHEFGATVLDVRCFDQNGDRVGYLNLMPFDENEVEVILAWGTTRVEVRAKGAD